eukprot:CAMPEP_0204398330 /NCGR_PEP_ID=MMETSP0470-20130426/2724_1 /ASSEMBLY_ACC=CAM_ASM_000385 /TAXON_ID=2969 /ORGANISM="Oxyrrhis marina" /LENGTH=157 /DNA_ID=CAMNT_0051392915 /DNA_START=99 /DNA_END=570 /DNA_ORIENTATION=-
MSDGLDQDLQTIVSETRASSTFKSDALQCRHMSDDVAQQLQAIVSEIKAFKTEALQCRQMSDGLVQDLQTIVSEIKVQADTLQRPFMSDGLDESATSLSVILFDMESFPAWLLSVQNLATQSTAGAVGWSPGRAGFRLNGVSRCDMAVGNRARNLLD